MKAYIMLYRHRCDWEEQGVEKVFDSREKAIKYLEQEMSAKHLSDDTWETEHYWYHIEEHEVEQ